LLPLLSRHLLVVESDADNPVQKKLFNFMKSGIGSQKRLRENVKKEAKSHPFLEPLLKITKHKL
jgi:hypothetical protein